MLEAFFSRDASFDGIFVTAVRTTGIFCRPSCPARKPLRRNISFFPSAREALNEGYRPCKRCRPMADPGEAPPWLAPLLTQVEREPTRRWTDAQLRAEGLCPARVRRWFKAHHGMTFHAFSRARRLGAALGWMNRGTPVTHAAFDSGYESLSGFQEAFRRYFGSNPTSTAGTRTVYVDRVATPLGPMLVGADDEALCLLEFVDRRGLPRQIERIRSRLKAAFVPAPNPLTEGLSTQLRSYFEGSLRTFDTPLIEAGTPFQAEVWAALRAIPYGETRSYTDLATSLGRPTAVRAVANANGANALAIVIPCHRVVGADGGLVGYGGGLWRKRWLLELERGRALP
ncbi:MAG: methylated-DNA--[protein]-cysteine S-methyltransferase [Gemmatimonadetes bacterium]|nr:methylated-DNA--[protein]-cysteine S-methyltransferase [Gemmatimonadota bacterium]